MKNPSLKFLHADLQKAVLLYGTENDHAHIPQYLHVAFIASRWFVQVVLSPLGSARCDQLLQAILWLILCLPNFFLILSGWSVQSPYTCLSHSCHSDHVVALLLQFVEHHSRTMLSVPF